MTKLTIAPEVFEKIPSLIIITGSTLVRTSNDPVIAEYLSKSYSQLCVEVNNHGYKTHPLISSWRDALIKARIPVKKFPPSIEAMAKRTISSDTPFTINPIVDTYNAISMDLILPFGAYDIDQLDGDLQLRLSSGGEQFRGLGSQESEQTVEGEIVYADDSDVLTRQFLWRQSEKGKILDSTKNIIFVCELLESMGKELVEKSHQLILEKFRTLLNAEVTNLLVLKS